MCAYVLYSNVHAVGVESAVRVQDIPNCNLSQERPWRPPAHFTPFVTFKPSNWSANAINAIKTTFSIRGELDLVKERSEKAGG